MRVASAVESPAGAALPGRSYDVWQALQRAAAFASVVMLGPVLIGIAALVALLSRRSPLVAHRRTGQNGRPFWMLKFRTMWGDPPAGEESVGCCRLVARLGQSEHRLPMLKEGSDPRVKSRVGRFLRRHSLDELPQLLHVVSGRMALVGPRPLLECELAAYYGDCIEEVLSVPPGVTGLWQVMGRSLLSYRQRRRLDLFLVRRRSVLLDLRILGKTVPQVVIGANAW